MKTEMHSAVCTLTHCDALNRLGSEKSGECAPRCLIAETESDAEREGAPMDGKVW